MTSPDDFDNSDLGSSTEDAPAETPSESSADSSSSDEPSEPIIEIEEEKVEAIDDSNASTDGESESAFGDEVALPEDDDEDGWEGEPPSNETNENQEPADEVLAEIVDPRLATVEGGSVVDTSIPDPRVLTEEACEPEPVLFDLGPTVEQLKAELAAAVQARDFAHDSYRSAVTKLQAAEEAGARAGVALSNEVALRQETEAALRDAQAALLETSMRASNLEGELTSAHTELAHVQRDLAALGNRSVFQIIPAHKKGQARDTRVYVLADDAADAIRRVEKAGAVLAADVENITKTSQKLVI